MPSSKQESKAYQFAFSGFSGKVQMSCLVETETNKEVTKTKSGINGGPGENDVHRYSVL